MPNKKKKREYVTIPQGEGHYDRVEVKKPKKRENYKSANAANKKRRTKHYQTGADSCKCGGLWPCSPTLERITIKDEHKRLWLFNHNTGMPWDHTHEKSGGSSHCMACIVEGTAPRASTLWAEWVQELTKKLGHTPGHQSLDTLIGPKWAEDAKQKWVVNWTVDGWLACRPHLKTHAMLRDRGGDGVGAEHSPSPRWSVTVSKRGVHFNIDHQGFMLREDYDPDDGWSKEAYYRWYAKQLTIAFQRLFDAE